MFHKNYKRIKYLCLGYLAEIILSTDQFAAVSPTRRTDSWASHGAQAPLEF